MAGSINVSESVSISIFVFTDRESAYIMVSCVRDKLDTPQQRESSSYKKSLLIIYISHSIIYSQNFPVEQILLLLK